MSRYYLILYILFILASFIEIHCQSLSGIKVLAVLVNPNSTNDNYYGLTDMAIKNEVELRLQMAGIKVVEYSKLRPTSAYIQVDYAILGEGSRITCLVNFNIFEPVKIIRSGEIDECVTWGLEALASTPASNVKNLVMNSVNDLTTDFLNQYLKDN